MVEQVFGDVRAAPEVAVATLDTDSVTPRDAAQHVQVLTAIEKLAAGARLMLLARAAQDDGWRAAGETSAADHLARRAGTTSGSVRDAIKSSEQLGGLPATRAAVAAGRLSSQQAAAVAAAASIDPAAEAALLQAAVRESLAGLRQECARVTAAGSNQSERERLQQRRRSFRTWTDEIGSVCGRFSLPAVTGAELLAILQPFRDHVFAAARHAGTRDSYDNYTADGLLEMARAADGSPDAAGEPPTNPAGRPLRTSSAKRPKARIQVRCDYTALRRGHTQAGEIAEIPGVGPISITAVRELFDDAIINILVTKGRDITTIATNTRYIPQPLRIALTERDPTCFITGCNHRLRLEHDHQTLFSDTHDTSIGNLHRACPQHHNLKTRHHYQFTHTPTGWQCTPPDREPDQTGPAP